MEAGSTLQHEVVFASGEQRPALGLGTWRFGEQPAHRSAEMSSVRHALDMDWRLINTAELNGAGGAEDIVGQALEAAQRGGSARRDFFVVSKVLPDHAGERAMIAACEASLRRLRLDCIDGYLLHWRGKVPLAEAVRGFEQLQRRNWIRMCGVSNFDLADLADLRPSA